MNSMSATATPARSAIAMPSPVASTGFVVTANTWPAPPVVTSTLVARTSVRRPAVVERHHAAAAAALDDEVEREVVLVDGGRGPLDRGDQRPLDLRAGGGAAGVDDAGEACGRPRARARGDRRRRGRTWRRG